MPKDFDEIDPLHVPKMDVGFLMWKAVQQYEYRTGKKVDLNKESQRKLDHICLNFLRHAAVVNYNKINKKYFNGANEDEYFKWFKKVNLGISEKYPHLKKAVKQQISQKKRTLETVQ